MFTSEAAEAVRLVLTQFLLKNLKFGVIEGLSVLAPASAFWLFVASLLLEFRDMQRQVRLPSEMPSGKTKRNISSQHLTLSSRCPHRTPSW